jgi:hypothetical protein
MLRVRLIPAAIFAIAGLALAGCTSTSMPSWMTIKPPPPPVVVLQFDSEPSGADVRTVDGQTCRTPCSLALSLTAQAVNFTMNGHVPQSAPVDVAQGDTPNFLPNPVQVTLQAVEAKPPVKPKPPKNAKTAKTAASKTAAKRAPAPASAAPDSAFPPPPPPSTYTPAQPQSAAPSPFPPPPPSSPSQQ